MRGLKKNTANRFRMRTSSNCNTMNKVIPMKIILQLQKTIQYKKILQSYYFTKTYVSFKLSIWSEKINTKILL